MKPRIFISSTFYDLKYIREDLSNFIKAHDFEPILFEDGDIGYIPGKALDESCYESMRNSDMVILIIGGNYGSPATNEVEDDFKEYLSITRSEFRTAMEKGIPVFVFIETGVYREYGVYESNINAIEKEDNKLIFPSTKNINVFRFIKEINTIGNIPIIEFAKTSEMKEFLSKQWSDMFKSYLKNLKDDISNRKVENTVTDIKMLIQKMEIMLDNVGKKILINEGEDNYYRVVNRQEIIEVSNCILESLSFDIKRGQIDEVNRCVDCVYEMIIHFDDEKYLKVSNEEKVSEAIVIMKKYNVSITGLFTFIFNASEKVKKIMEKEENRRLIADNLFQNEYDKKI